MEKYVEVRKVFSIGLLIALSYYFLWYAFRALAIEWHTVLNVPGFMLLAGSMPWSYPFASNLLDLSIWLGYFGRDVLVVLTVSLGFATNLTLLSFIFNKATNAIKSNPHHAS